jgi:Flp pilus assembly pilin Flp
MKKRRNRRSGQTLVEYIIVIVVVALAALAILGVFSDRVRSLIGGAGEDLGADPGKVEEALDEGSVEKLKSYEDKVED